MSVGDPPSYDGTFDQSGSLWEWNDLDGSAAPNRGLRGGAYTSSPPYLQSSYCMGDVPSGTNANGGFRLTTAARRRPVYASSSSSAAASRRS